MAMSGPVGTDFVQVWARNRGSTATYQDWRSAGPIALARPGLSLTTITSTVSLYATVGRPSTWTVAPNGGHLPLFKFWLYTEATRSWSVLQDYSAENVVTWTPDTLGRYLIQVWGRNADSPAPYDAWIGSGFFTVTTDTLELRSVTPNVTMPVGVGTPISWTALASGGTAVEYQFWLYEEGAGWSVVRDDSTASIATWTPARPGRYALQAWVRTVGESAKWTAWKGTPLFSVLPFPNVTGTWTLTRYGDSFWGYTTFTVGLVQSGTALTGWMSPVGGAGTPVEGSVSAAGVVYFGSRAPCWNNFSDGFFPLMLDDTGNSMISERCPLPSTCTYAIATRIQ